jgi:hypothetical protein
MIHKIMVLIRGPAYNLQDDPADALKWISATFYRIEGILKLTRTGLSLLCMLNVMKR